jgi:CobQ-like glutamine amidotransferase family enzyme
MDAGIMKVRIAHLYPELLNLYGDRGNVLALMHRLKLRGIDVEIRRIGVGERFDPQAHDLVFLGGGQDYEQAILMDDLLAHKASPLREAVAADKVFLCICGGYQLMGRYYRTAEGRQLDFVGALDLWTIGGEKRLIGNTAYRSGLLESEGRDPWLVGFENHSGRTYLGTGVKPLAKVVRGNGNNGEDGTEGAVFRNVFCTYSHGSVLPKNPALADLLLQRALDGRYGDIGPLADLDDTFEQKARDAAFKNLSVERNIRHER